MVKQKRIDGGEDTVFEVFYKFLYLGRKVRSASLAVQALSKEHAKEQAIEMLKQEHGERSFKVTSIREWDQ